MPPPVLRPHYTTELPLARKQPFLSHSVNILSYTDVRTALCQENAE